MELNMLLYVALISLGSVICSEKVCSSYDYERRLLTSAFKMENDLKELMQQKDQMETKIDAQFEHIANEMKALAARISEMEKDEGHQTRTCPLTYIYNEESNLCFRLEKYTKQNWFYARMVCSDENATLIILNNATAISIMQEFLRAEGADYVFVAASDIVKEGNFRWLNGELVQNIPWGSGEPTRGRRENCLVMHSAFDYQFAAYPCYEISQFLCQIIL